MKWQSASLVFRNGGFELYAYCLMDNHVHLLIKEGEELGTSIKRITVGYVQLHNNKYDRTGYLFQNRFFIENSMSFLAKNPVREF